jgi:hypothetical protein
MDSAPPGIQAEHERWSLVFFTRPGNSQVLRALVESSHVIAEAVKNRPEKNFETGSTAMEWFARRIKYQRINNRTVGTLLCVAAGVIMNAGISQGPETWAASRGTEHTPTAV